MFDLERLQTELDYQNSRFHIVMVVVLTVSTGVCFKLGELSNFFSCGHTSRLPSNSVHRPRSFVDDMNTACSQAIF